MMGISDKMGQMLSSVHEGAKGASSSLGLWIFKSVTAFLLGLTISMVGQEILAYGTISFVLVLLVISFTIGKLMSSWSWAGLLVFDLICILVALLLRMYLLIAP